MKRGLSKTSYKLGLQCPRALWLEFNNKAAVDLRFGEGEGGLAFGAEVGELARRYFPGTVLADTFDYDDPQRLSKASEETRRLIEAGEGVIAEATFFCETVLDGRERAVEGEAGAAGAAEVAGAAGAAGNAEAADAAGAADSAGVAGVASPVAPQLVCSNKCQVDLLVRDEEKPGKWKLIECKSGSVWAKKDDPEGGIREDFLNDVAFQLWCVEECGLAVSKVLLMHPNKEYRLHGELDVQGYFAFEDVTDEARSRAVAVPKAAGGMLAIAHGITEPQTICGDQCCKPKCPYLGHCLPEANRDDSVLWLYKIGRGKAIEYIKKGVAGRDEYLHAKTAELEAESKKPGVGERRRLLQCSGEEYLDLDPLTQWLNYLEGKTLYFLDFETLLTAVPRFEGDALYAQVPTQYSLHIVSPDGTCEHKEYLAQPEGDPWRGIAEALVNDIPKGAITVAWHKSFECDRIKAMAAKFPDFAEHLLDIVRDERPLGKDQSNTDQTGLGLVDMEDPFAQGWACEPAMGGKSSIKYVLPALFPNDPSLNYHNLENHDEGAVLVQNGSMAVEAFKAMAGMDEATRAATRENLLRYCELDTWAMVKVWLWLRRAAGLPALPKLPVEAPLPANE